MDKTNVVTLAAPRSPAAEAYRALRMNLTFTSLDKPLETLVVSSPSPEDAKSQVAVNLAVVMTQAGQRVILVDADLRRPSIHTFFDVPQEPGLTGYMVSQDGEEALALVETDVPGLQVLPSGALPPNPADILGAQKMEQLLAHLKARADVVCSTRRRSRSRWTRRCWGRERMACCWSCDPGTRDATALPRPKSCWNASACACWAPSSPIRPKAAC